MAVYYKQTACETVQNRYARACTAGRDEASTTVRGPKHRTEQGQDLNAEEFQPGDSLIQGANERCFKVPQRDGVGH